MWTRTLLALAVTAQLINAYDIVRDYSGASFFDGWDFYGSWDNLTNGKSILHISSTQSFLLIESRDPHKQEMSGGSTK